MVKFVPDHVKDMSDHVPDVDDSLDEELFDDDPVDDVGSEIRKILADAEFDVEDLIDRFIEHTDYSLPTETILDAFREFGGSSQGLRNEIRILYPIFISDHAFVKVDPLVPVKGPKTEKDIVRGRDIFGEGGREKYMKPDKRKLKKEDDLPQLISAEEMRVEHVSKIQKGESIVCELCGTVISTDEKSGWWLSIYPAHELCIHKEMNRRANAAGNPLPFPEDDE